MIPLFDPLQVPKANQSYSIVRAWAVPPDIEAVEPETGRPVHVLEVPWWPLLLPRDKRAKI